MQRSAPNSMHVVVTWTSAVVRRMSFLCSVGSSPGPIDITTPAFCHLRCPIGTVSRISEWSPVVANRTAPLGGLGARCECLPAPLDAGPITRTPRNASAGTATRTTPLRRPPRCRTARSIGAVRRVLTLRIGDLEIDPDVRAAAVGVAGGCLAAVCLRDRLDDRQAQPGAVTGSRGVGPAEALKGVGEEVGREAGPFVADVNLDSSVVRLGPHAH